MCQVNDPYNFLLVDDFCHMSCRCPDLCDVYRVSTGGTTGAFKRGLELSPEWSKWRLNHQNLEIKMRNQGIGAAGKAMALLSRGSVKSIPSRLYH